MVGVAVDQPHLSLPFTLPPSSSLATSDLLHHLGLHHGDVHHALVKQSGVPLIQRNINQTQNDLSDILTLVVLRTGLPGGLNLAMDGELLQLSSLA